MDGSDALLEQILKRHLSMLQLLQLHRLSHGHGLRPLQAPVPRAVLAAQSRVSHSQAPWLALKASILLLVHPTNHMLHSNFPPSDSRVDTAHYPPSCAQSKRIAARRS